MATLEKRLRLPGGMLTLRSATADDAPELLALLPVLHSETVFLSYEPGEVSMTETEERDFLQSFSDNPLALFLVAVMDGAIVGTCSAAIGKNRRVRHTAGIGIALRKSHWRKGIGKAMMTEAITWLGENGVERVGLSVDTFNHGAIALYMRLGFVVEGRAIHAHKLADGSYHDTYQMALDLRADSTPTSGKE